MTGTERIRELHRARPRSRVLRWSVAALAALVAYSWLCGEIDVADFFSSRRRDNLERFLTRDALPAPLRESGFSWGGLLGWIGGVLSDRGWEATLKTLWISVLAIVLAGLGAAFALPLATRTLMTGEPYPLKASEHGPSWRLLTGATRLLFIVLRAIPEYVWAFVFLAMLGANAWPAVLALAIHNAGILGRLGADTVENLDAAPLRSLRMLGASRRQIVCTAVVPLALPRYLLYFFYRFETCVREATVLGMLGVASLGYWIDEARGRQTYDEMLLLVAFGIVLVMAGDLASVVARGWIRRER